MNPALLTPDVQYSGQRSQGKANEGTASPASTGSASGQASEVRGAAVQMSAAEECQTKATVDASALNVREEPTTKGQKVGLLQKGATVEVVGQIGSWLQVNYNGVTAFIHGAYATVEDGSLQTDLPIAKIVASALNVRAKPSTSGGKVGLVHQGEEVDVVEVGSWLCIKFQNGIAYIHSAYADVTGSTESAPSSGESETETPAPAEPAIKKDPIAKTDECSDDCSGDVPTTDASLEALMAKDRLSVEEIAKARELIAKEPQVNRMALFEALQAKVEYHNQRDNESRGRKNSSESNASQDNMCNLTSLAMCLSYLGIPNPYPEMQYEDALEKLRIEKNLGNRTTFEGWGGVAMAMGANPQFLSSGSGAHAKTWWVKTVLPALQSGSAVMMSISGHIVRVQSVGDDGLMVDDPYGKCDLQPGEGRKWTGYNKKGEHDNKGEDVVWPWSQVESHVMRWVCAFSV
ncbi:MAG: SH3 domain-containing protein [Myxococcales bacterium]|nr:SH3 domain-containing protein [Myxococcales bacterium]